MSQITAKKSWEGPLTELDRVLICDMKAFLPKRQLRTGRTGRHIEVTYVDSDKNPAAVLDFALGVKQSLDDLKFLELENHRKIFGKKGFEQEAEK